MQRFEAYEDLSGKWRWRLLAADETITASSGESFSSQAAALRAAERVRAAAPAAAVSPTPGLGIKAALRLRALLGAGDSQRRPLRAAPGDSKPKRRRARRTPADPVDAGDGGVLSPIAPAAIRAAPPTWVRDNPDRSPTGFATPPQRRARRERDALAARR